MRSRGEKLRYAGRVETRFSQTEGCPQTGSSSADDNGIVFVINDRIFAGDESRRLLCPQVLGSEYTLRRPGRRESACGWAETPRELLTQRSAIDPS
jgi:hypothetical protein